jgi:hypothetical protein
MALRRKSSKTRGSLNTYEAAWLEGDREAGFMHSLHHDFVHQELWKRAGGNLSLGAGDAVAGAHR